MRDELVGRLALGPDHLLQTQNLANEQPIRLFELIVLFLQGLDLVLGRRERLAQDDDLLRRRERVVDRRGFPRGRRLSPDIVQVVFPIGAELGMSELPCLPSKRSACHSFCRAARPPTSRPYGDSPLSSLCLTLWKSYLFNWRTKLAKLLCLKCFGRIIFVNFSFCHARSQSRASPMAIGVSVSGPARRTSRTTKLSPSALHRTTELYVGSSSILRRHW